MAGIGPLAPFAVEKAAVDDHPDRSESLATTMKEGFDEPGTHRLLVAGSEAGHLDSRPPEGRVTGVAFRG